MIASLNLFIVQNSRHQNGLKNSHLRNSGQEIWLLDFKKNKLICLREARALSSGCGDPQN
jgi:hypothetical protein